MITEREEAIVKRKIDKLITDQEKETSRYSKSLKEKGIECAILMPIFEYYLGFDPIEDIEYEVTSNQVNGQRFDFLLDKKFVVETKAFGLNLTTDIAEQICNYISANDNINYGILTNGWSFIFYIQRSYIEKLFNNGESIPGQSKSVYTAFGIDIDDKYFYETLKLFQKPVYEYSFKNIANYVYRQLISTKGRMTPIHSDKKIDESIKDKIANTIAVKRGYYFNQITDNSIQVGDKLCYDDGNINIPFIVLSDGCIKLEKNTIQIKDINKVLNDGKFMPLINLIANEWYSEDTIFSDPFDVIKQATGMQRLHQKNKYKFNCI